MSPSDPVKPVRIICILLCALCVGLRVQANETSLYDAAKREGAVTWYITHYSGELAQEAGHKFTDKYPGVMVNVVRTTAQVAFAKLSQDIKVGVPSCDVFSSTDIGHYIELKKTGLIAQFEPESAQQISPQFVKFIDAGYYYPTSVGLVLITYNSKMVSADDVPRNWTDLLDPKWQGKVTVAHPAFSGYAGAWALQMRMLYGVAFLQKLEKNKPLIGRSINDSVTRLNSGESVIAAGADNTTLESASRGNPLAIVYPTDGTILMVSPSSIMKNAPHPNAARLFMEYLLSADYSEVMVKHAALPVRSGIAASRGLKPLNEIRLIRPNDAELVAGIPSIIEDWRDVFGN
jgi:iron(III) transport system substrate-binding protein